MRPLASFAALMIGCSFSGGASPGTTPEPDAATGIDAPTGDGDPGADARRRVISVGAVPANAAVANVPVPVRLSGDADLMVEAAADGSDLLFQLADGTRLPHDVERLDAAAGDLVAWVVLPSLPAAGASFELYYGGDNVAPAARNTWIGLADLVFHFETVTGDLPDHSASGFDGAYEGDGVYALTGGQIGDAVDATNSGILLSDGASVDRGAESFSLTLWFDQNATVGAADLAWFKGGFSNPGYQVTTGTGAWRVNIEDENGNLVQAVFGDEIDLGPAGFVHLALVVDRTGDELRAYTDGAIAATTPLPMGFGSLSATGTVARVGAQGDTAADADYDELRAYPLELSAEFIAVDHALGSNASLITVGAADAASYPGS